MVPLTLAIAVALFGFPQETSIPEPGAAAVFGPVLPTALGFAANTWVRKSPGR